MHTVVALEKAIAVAERAGFIVRQDWSLGRASGAFEFKGRRWILIDLAQSASEQLEVVLEAIRCLPEPNQLDLDAEIRALLGQGEMGMVR